jgi:transposase
VTKARTWVGLDVHAAKVVACVVDAESGEMTVRRLRGDTSEVVAFCAGLPGPIRVAYEAGPTGFGLARALHAAGISCVIAAPGKIERPAQDRVKTDRRDAERLARLPERGAQATLLDYPGAIDALSIRRDQLEATTAELAPVSPWAQDVARLRCMRGIDTLTAIGLCAEISDLARLEHPKQLISYVGLVPSQKSSGQTRRQGAITKSGSQHARRLLTETA